MVSFDEALKLALDSVKVVDKVEQVTIAEALGRVVSQDIIAKKNLPPYDNSAMDGYAFDIRDIKSKMRVAKTIYAGDIVEPMLESRECYKIMTGAKVPSDANSVAPYEICRVDGEYIEVEKELKEGSNLRKRGEELECGAIIIKRGEILNASKIALLASQGITSCQVYKKLTILIVSTGNELKEYWEESSDNEVYNINAINLQMHLKERGFESQYIGKLPDNFDDTKDMLSKIDCDILITTGGISKGDADYIYKALVANSFIEIFGGIKVKPGHPTTFGTMGNTFVMALPGNPLAAIVNFLLLSMRVIYKMQGANRAEAKSVKAKMRDRLKLKSGRNNIVLGTLKGGYFTPYKNNKYGSGMISPLVESNAVANFDLSVEVLEANEEIEVVLVQ